jgi:hypothetical protein
VDSEARPNDARSNQCLVPELRNVPLRKLAEQAAAGETDVTGVVSRLVESRESPSGVPAMMFNSTI